jgi:alpha-beta hydrolase superfamily lysophospholipase
MLRSEGFFRGFGGLELYYQKWTPDGRYRSALIYIHGFGDHCSRHENLVKSLVGGFKALYSFDLRGHGRSPGQRGYIGSWEELRGDVRAFVGLVREMDEGIPLFLMGQSMGGLIVLEYALHHPQGLTGVIAAAPAIGKVGVAAWKMTLGRFLSSVWPRFSMNAGLNDADMSRDPEVVKASDEDPLTHSRGTTRLASELQDAITWTLSHAPEFPVPLLVLHGSADRVVAPEVSRWFFEDVTLDDKERIEYPGGYHELDNDTNHEEVLRDLNAWLEKRH